VLSPQGEHGCFPEQTPVENTNGGNPRPNIYQNSSQFFFSNALLAAGLAFVGERLGIDLYLAAVVAFGVRLFQNLAIIRRHLLKK
jgi:hypothetical protein